MAKRFIGSVEDEWQLYSDNPEDYTLGPSIGFGASSIVYSALYQPRSSSGSKPIPVALKVLDLDSLPPHALSLLKTETTLMSLSKHPNVLRVRGYWMDGHKLYIAMRLMNKGSAADVMRYGWPGGMEEDVIRCILSQALQGLNYLHINGFIHRDIKAANLLIDDDGTVLLGDLGVAANLDESSSPVHTIKSTTDAASTTSVDSNVSTPSSHSANNWHHHKHVLLFDHGVHPTPVRPDLRKRKSFVGTPCWMAPELIQGQQYDAAADIWSFGITALELAQGRPPRSRDSSQQVLLKIIHEAPPTLTREGGVHKYSRAFKEMVDNCLVKDPSNRPTAAELLQTPFFKSTKRKSYLVGAILKDLPPLAQRQERRAKNRHSSTCSIDSWDFATTVHAHVGGVKLSMGSSTPLDRTPAYPAMRQEGIFEMDDNDDSAMPYAKSASTIGNEALAEDDVEADLDVDDLSHNQESLSTSPSESNISSSPPSSVPLSLSPTKLGIGGLTLSQSYSPGRSFQESSTKLELGPGKMEKDELGPSKGLGVRKEDSGAEFDKPTPLAIDPVSIPPDGHRMRRSHSAGHSMWQRLKARAQRKSSFGVT